MLCSVVTCSNHVNLYLTLHLNQSRQGQRTLPTTGPTSTESGMRQYLIQYIPNYWEVGWKARQTGAPFTRLPKWTKSHNDRKQLWVE